MPFPQVVPTQREFEPGDWPGSKLTMSNGVEVRLLRGTREAGRKLRLTYANIEDRVAEEFLTHYQEVMGTYAAFELSTASTPPNSTSFSDGAKQGWKGTGGAIGATIYGKWRYSGAPRLSQVKVGVSTVTIELLQVLV